MKRLFTLFSGPSGNFLKYTFFAITLTLGSGALFPLNARHLPADEALARISASRHSKAADISKQRNIRLVREFRTGADSDPLIYFYRSADDGFLVLSADDRVAPLIGYSDNDALFNNDDDLPESLEYYLATLAEELDFSLAEMNKKGWSVTFNSNATNVNTDEDSASIGAPIAPLMPTIWGQTGYYDLYTPTVDDKQCPSGCVATALAQIMYTHKWPAKPVGTASCRLPDKSKLDIDFSDIYFDWSEMTPVYDENSSPESIEAVSTLMQAVGYAVNMNYNTGGSGATTSDAVIGLINNLGYSGDVRYLRRQAFTKGEWERMIYTQLAAGLPVFHTGRDQVWLGGGGHAFACDGYDGQGYFHFNWGWEGSYNGWFVSTCLTPTGAGTGGFIDGYNYSQEILINLYPDDGMPHKGYDFTAASSFAFEDGLLKMDCEHSPDLSAPYEIGISISEDSASIPIRVVSLGSYAGNASISQPLDASITLGLDPESSYTLRMVWRNDAEDWQRILSPVEGLVIYKASNFGGLLTCQNGVWTLTPGVVDKDYDYDLTLQDLTFDGKNLILKGFPTIMRMSLKNNSDDYFYHPARLNFMDVNTGERAKFINFSLELRPDEEVTKSWSLVTTDYPSGDYILQLTEAAYGDVIWTDTEHIYRIIDPEDLEKISDGIFDYWIIDDDDVRLIGVTSGEKLTGDITIPDTFVHEGTEYKITTVMPKLSDILDPLATVNLTIKAPISAIESFLFSRSESIENVEIPDVCTEIESYAFNNASNLKHINLHSYLTSIGNSAFYNCKNLETKLNLPATITSLGTNVFYGCAKLSGEIIIPENLSEVPNYLFNGCTSLTGTPVIPNHITRIGSGVFNKCSGLSGKIHLPDSLQNMGSFIFTGCNGLSGNVIIPAGVTEIGSYLFYNCPGITDIGVAARAVPTLDKNLLSAKHNVVAIRVMPEMIEAYKETDNWGSYSGLFKEYADANNNSTVNVADAVAVINNLNGSPNASFDILSADINLDDTITDDDINAIAAAAMAYGIESREASIESRESGVESRKSEVENEKEDTTESIVGVKLDCEDRVVAVQMDIYAATPINASDISTASETIDEAEPLLKVAELADGGVRVMIYSRDCRMLEPGEYLLDIAGITDPSEVVIENTIGASPQAEDLPLSLACRLRDISSGVKSISSEDLPADSSIVKHYDLQGLKLTAPTTGITIRIEGTTPRKILNQK